MVSVSDTSVKPTNFVEYDASTHDVDSVTVYQADRAELKRQISVDLIEGQNEVKITNLPTCIDEGSIRVNGVGNAVIFDVVFRQAPPINSGPKLSEKMKELKERREELQAQLNVYENQSRVLSKYSESMTSKDASLDLLKGFLDMYSTRQLDLDKSRGALRKQLVNIEKEYNDEDQRLKEEERNIGKRGASVVIVVFAPTSGEAELMLTYVVSGARWTPQYDLRAFVSEEKGSTSLVKLNYRASIIQSTGEDWKDVYLTLSTASPLRGTAVPSLSPYWIAEKEAPKPVTSFGSAVTSMAPRGQASMMKRSSVTRGLSNSSANEVVWSPPTTFSHRAHFESLDSGLDLAPPSAPLTLAPPPPAVSRQAVASEGTISASFTIPGQSTIPSEGDGAAHQSHKVSITEVSFENVGLRWVTVPKQADNVFLECKIKNTSNYILLAGEASVFFNDDFVSKTNVPYVSPQESFACSLGVDPAVRVTYRPQVKKVKVVTGPYGLGPKNSVTSFEQVISIKNVRRTAVHPLIVRDQIPVSRDARINVKVVEPKDLQDDTKKSTVRGPNSSGPIVTSRWALTEDQEDTPDASGEKDKGLVEWVLDMEPGTNTDIKLAWDVTVPHELEWTKVWF